jgi:hypothetical protein
MDYYRPAAESYTLNEPQTLRLHAFVL